MQSIIIGLFKNGQVYDNGHQSRPVLKILVKAYQPKISEEDKRQLKLILKPVHFILTDCLSVYDNGHQSRPVLKILVKAYQPKISEEDKRQLKLILKPVHFILTDCLSFILALCGIDCIAHGERCKLRSTCYDRLIIHCI